MFPGGPSVVEKDAERINKHENLVISVAIIVPWGSSHYEKAREHLYKASLVIPQFHNIQSLHRTKLSFCHNAQSTQNRMVNPDLADGQGARLVP